jgi:hypothetical protein
MVGLQGAQHRTERRGFGTGTFHNEAEETMANGIGGGKGDMEAAITS